MIGRPLRFGLLKLLLLLAVIPTNPDVVKSENIFQLEFYANVTIPYFLYPLKKWFAKYFKLALSTIMCNFIV